METRTEEFEKLRDEFIIKFTKLVNSRGYKLACIGDSVVSTNHANLIKLIKAIKDDESQFIPTKCDVNFKSIVKIIDMYIDKYTKTEEEVTENSLPLLYEEFRSKVNELTEVIEKLREEITTYPNENLESMVYVYESGKLSFDIMASSYNIFISEVNNDETRAIFVIDAITDIIKNVDII